MTVLIKNPKTMTGTLQQGGQPKPMRPFGPIRGTPFQQGPANGGLTPGIPKPSRPMDLPRTGGAGPSMGGQFDSPGLTPGMAKPDMPIGSGSPIEGGFRRPGFPSGAPQGDWWYKQPDMPQAPAGGGFTRPGFPSGGPSNDGMIRLDPREMDGTFNSPPAGGGFTQPGFPSGQGPQFPPNPDKSAGIIQKPAPPTAGTKSQPQKAAPKSMNQANPAVMQKFMTEAMGQGFDPKTILSFLSGRMKK